MTNNKYKVGFFVLLALVLIATLSSCSTRDQARWKGAIDLGELPTDIVYVDGVPQMNISSESDGDLILSYVSTRGVVVGQLYGCAVININCMNLHKQGSYEFKIPAEVIEAHPELYKP